MPFPLQEAPQGEGEVVLVLDEQERRHGSATGKQDPESRLAGPRQ